MVMTFVVNLAIALAADITGEWVGMVVGLALTGWGLGVTIHGLVVGTSPPQSFGSTDNADSTGAR